MLAQVLMNSQKKGKNMEDSFQSRKEWKNLRVWLQVLELIKSKVRKYNQFIQKEIIHLFLEQAVLGKAPLLLPQSQQYK